MDRIEAIRAHYEARMHPGRANYDVLDWASAASQRTRFEVLARHVPLAGKTLLDVGCGLGDLLAFLREHGIAADYTGVDVLGKMVDACRRRFRDGRFVRADVFRGEPVPPGQFDVVFTSGVFNLNLRNNLEFLPAAIRRLLALAREHLVFNLLHVRSPYKEDDYFFYDPEHVLAVVREELSGGPPPERPSGGQRPPHSGEVRLIDNYLPNDFTIICGKPGAAGVAGGT